MELKPNTFVNLTIGRKARIIEEIGRGGQGIVYRVELDGKMWALKWYIKCPQKAFYDNLANNISKGAPDDAFLWPEFLTEKQYGSFGYIMKLRPDNYYEFSNFILAKKKFTSFRALLNASIKICEGFANLHRRGYSYQDINDGNFFINPSNGDVLICDNDNVMPQGDFSGIGGKMRYMAPEIVTGSKKPDKYSDRFSLSVVLFMLIYGNHPFEGARTCACPCMNEKMERKYYGAEPIFIYDIDDPCNLPIRGVHNNVIKRWNVLPKILKDTFQREFSQEYLKNPLRRMVDMEWIKVLQQVSDSLVSCPGCGEETFAVMNTDSRCNDCGKTFTINGILQYDNRKILLTPKSVFSFSKTLTKIDGKVVQVEGSKFKYQIENLSDNGWVVETPSGKLKTISHNENVPILSGLKIKVENKSIDIITL